MQAVILAGGLATRLHPRTLTTPKSLLKLADRPFILWQLEALRGSGFSEVLLCIGHHGEQIRAALGDGTALRMAITYSDEGRQRLGTAGALRLALERLTAAFLVTYGDSYLPFDYSDPLRDLQAHPEALGTMSVYRNHGRWDASNTHVEGELVVEHGKAFEESGFAYIDYGAIALRREVIEALPLGPLGLDQVLADLARQRRLRAWVARERFYEIGSEAGLAELDAKLREAHEEPGEAK